VNTQQQEQSDWKRATSPWTEPFRQSQEMRAVTESSPAPAADPAQAQTQPMQQHQHEADAVDPTRDALSTIFYGN
jgi:hypothetical protein